MRPSYAFAALTLLIVATGCSKSTYPVQGRVTLADGTPVANAYLVFESIDQKLSSKAKTNDSGEFVLSTHSAGDGAYLGEYRALVMPPAETSRNYNEESGEMIEEEGDAANDDRELFDPKYTRFETSGLNFTIEKTGNDLQIILKQS